ncbi:Probable 28S ribosomal protein S26, mitochondrial [Strongyloides ratti]|uniref:Small ribosomal subunit protein mS26 n=1 Tax=Strongyloides ratti TaxID=34506 RepID=A0A090KYU7_STRRB|nr:Probable 28S ribosomal protein S26, mitochondrial [Strongyloides ratti]CEF62611.1 Probable 28S ribosomal protein S26, mitochondrial [Strongyloides ratti]
MFNKSFLSNKALLLSSVRFFRRKQPKQGKPPILPPSKKVLYNIVNVPWQKKEVVEELLWRRHVYNNAMITMREIFKQEVDMKESAGVGLEALRVQEKEELENCLLLNEERNKKLRAEREKRDAEELIKTKEEIFQKICSIIKDEEQNTSIRREEVLRLIEQSPNFITKENLDEKLEEALKNPASFDYAIDVHGNVTQDLPRFI